MVAAAYFSLIIGVLLGPLPPYVLVGMLALPLHLRALRLLWVEAGNPQSLRPAIEERSTGQCCMDCWS